MKVSKMFKNLLNFEHKRTGKEAAGFYLAFLILNLLVGGALGVIFGQGNSFSSGFLSGVVVGEYGAIVIQLIIGILILSKRKRYLNLFSIILVVLSVILSKLGGGLLGLIPLAYLTTQ